MCAFDQLPIVQQSSNLPVVRLSMHQHRLSVVSNLPQYYVRCEAAAINGTIIAYNCAAASAVGANASASSCDTGADRPRVANERAATI